MKNAETMPVVTIISEMITLLQLVCVILVMIDTSGSIYRETSTRKKCPFWPTVVWLYFFLGTDGARVVTWHVCPV